MKPSQSTSPLRLPRSIKAEVERRAKAEGISVNQFVATAVAEKLAAMNTAAFFAERRERADFAASHGSCGARGARSLGRTIKFVEGAIDDGRLHDITRVRAALKRPRRRRLSLKEMQAAIRSAPR